MTTRQHFRSLMAERRMFPRGSADHAYRTRAGRKLVWLMRGVPTDRWETME